MRRLHSMAGTTLVELLVVIVVLLIGILAILQIFPGGLQILALNRNSEIATKLAQDEAERFVGRPDQMPEEIDPVTYSWDSMNNRVVAAPDPTRRPGDNSLVNTGTLDSNGDVIDAGGHNLGYWPYLSGPNLFRRIVGEGGRVPAPRQVGNFYGGLMVLQFTPIVFNSSIPGQFEIYGAKMVRNIGAPTSSDTPQRFEYYVQDIDQPDATLILPQDAFQQRIYNVDLSAYITNSGVTRKEDFKDREITVPSGGGTAAFYSVPLNTSPGGLLGLNPGDSFEGAELESVQVAREYDEVTNLNDPFSDPYQYKLLDADLGLILFSDQAYNAYELRNGRREPLEAHVNYDVYDWRIMRDEFRVPDDPVPQVKLELGNLKVMGNRDVDGSVYKGLFLLLQNGSGKTEHRDIALMDLETGGIILPTSATRTTNGVPKQLIRIDKSVGLLTFFDADDDPANGVTGEIVYPGASQAVDVNLTGRPIRAMYEARGEWMTQVTMAPVVFGLSLGAPGIAQYYVGGSNPSVGGSNTRIYFPLSDAGQRVTIDQIWYDDPTNSIQPLQSLQNQSFVVQTLPADPTGLAYVDIQSINPNATSFDTNTYGYAVTGVKGASVTVRVLWNPSNLSFGNDGVQNLQNLEIWGRAWRQTVAETYIRRPGE